MFSIFVFLILICEEFAVFFVRFFQSFTDQEPNFSFHDFYGILHDADHSIITVKIISSTDDTLSVDEESRETSPNKASQTVAMPMLWHYPSFSDNGDVSMADYRQNDLSSTALNSEQIISYSTSLGEDPVLVLRGSTELSNSTVKDVVDGPAMSAGCLQTSRQQIWHAIAACRAFLRL